MVKIFLVVIEMHVKPADQQKLGDRQQDQNRHEQGLQKADVIDRQFHQGQDHQGDRNDRIERRPRMPGGVLACRNVLVSSRRYVLAHALCTDLIR